MRPGHLLKRDAFRNCQGRPASVSQAPCQTRAQLRDVSVSALAQPLRSFWSGFSALPRKYIGHRLTWGLIFRCRGFPPFRCVHGALEARTLKWFAFSSPGDHVLPGSDWQGRALHPLPVAGRHAGRPGCPMAGPVNLHPLPGVSLGADPAWDKALLASPGGGYLQDWSWGRRTPRRGALPGLAAATGRPGAVLHWQGLPLAELHPLLSSPPAPRRFGPGPRAQTPQESVKGQKENILTGDFSEDVHRQHMLGSTNGPMWPVKWTPPPRPLSITGRGATDRMVLPQETMARRNLEGKE